jgi:AraC-like DNA-binding protein
MDSNISFRGIQLYGNDIKIEKDEHTSEIFYIENKTGTAEISCYQVFSGVELFYNDIHLARCNQEETTAKNIIEINHCREGRYECSFGENSCCYMAEGDLSIGALTRKKSFSTFPLSHYHGITIIINLDELLSEVRSIMSLLNIDLDKIQKYICEENRCCIMRSNPSIEHIFSELYHVKEQRKGGYMKIKILELLVFLSDLDTNEELVQTQYYNQKQVRLIKEAAAFITEDLTKHYTIEQLAQKFEISATALKKCFRGVYGSSLYSYLRTYKLQIAEKMLIETSIPITEIATKIGYENPNKFTSAFKSVYGVPPTDFRKGVQMDRN